MSTIKGRTYSSPKNINLKQGILRFDVTKSSNPLSLDSNGRGIYVDSSNQLIYWNGTSTTVLGSGGGGGTPQSIVNANTAIDIIHGVTTIANDGASTHTLADGTVGQRKTIVCTVYVGDAVITPDNLANGTTITLNAVGDACDIVFLGTEWWVTNLYGTAALA